MANPIIPDKPRGILLEDEQHPGFYSFSFVPPKEKLRDAGLNEDNPMSYIVPILDVNAQDNYIQIFPINTFATHPEFLKYKYPKLKSITLSNFDFGLATNQGEVEEMLDILPSGFVKDFNYGLGFLKEFKFIVDTLEELDFEHLVIDKDGETSLDEENKIITLKYSDYDEIRKGINRVSYATQKTARKVKRASTYNTLCFFIDDKKFPQKPLDIKDTYIERSIAKASDIRDINISESERKHIIKTVSKNARKILGDDSHSLVKLKNEIELVSLEDLMSNFSEMIGKKLAEDKWQDLFQENPFILNLLFGYPIIKIQDQASVGGRKLSGKGDKITDFLSKNVKTNNTAIVEIKNPHAKLLNAREYREGVFSPSGELSGSLNQTLDQRYKLQKEIATIKENTRNYDIETFSVHCVLVIGTTPEGHDERKSFEIFRRNSKDVDVITFDEVLEKLKQLHEFLTSENLENKEDSSHEQNN
ncbi:MAG: hypothetical protein ACJAS4_003986 [Bacteriovoracaceae bacterium]|jgi:hypothetical protein